MENSHEMLLKEIKYLSDRTREIGRISPDFRTRLVEIGNIIRKEFSDARTVDAARLLINAARRDDAVEVHSFLTLLSDLISREFFPVESLTTLRSRISELENENDELKAQLQTASRDRQENAAKRFVASKNRVFVIMPFDHEFDDVWTGGIRRACEDGGFASLRVDQISLSSWITEDVKGYIDKSKIVISDVTGSNPNVMFELGYAIAKQRGIIIISQHRESEKVPFDIAVFRRLEYQNSWQGIETLSKKLKEYLLATKESQKGRREVEPSKQKNRSK